MKQSSTIFLRGVVILIGAAVLAVCIFALPTGIREDTAGYYRPIMWGLYVAAIPFFIALYQTMKLLGHIDHNEAFSELAVTTLKKIKYCALVIGALFAAGMPYIYIAAQWDDAPGVFAMGLVIAFASLVIAVFAAVLQKLLKSAIDIKAENDLTV